MKTVIYYYSGTGNLLWSAWLLAERLGDVKVCPAKNIALESGKPVWQHRCEQCLACIQWCPQESIQFGKKTPAYGRYHHPEIALKDILP